LNCSYYVDDYFGNVKLKGGRYLKKDEGYECLVQLLAQTWGDINGDGQIDALVVLTGEACGGNGLEFYLIPVLNYDGIPKVLKPVYLGDRICVRSLTVKNGIVIGVFEERSKFILKYKLVGDHLEKIE